MKQGAEAEKIVRHHAMWAAGSGLIPIPLVDVTAITAVQVAMLEQLAQLYDASLTQSVARTFISALTGTGLAVVGASLIKAIPGIGTLGGGLALSAAAGAATYGVGQVAISQFAAGRSLLDIDPDKARQAYKDAFAKGKEVIAGTQSEPAGVSDVLTTLEKLGQLRESEVISEEEFAEQKGKLLARL